MKVFIGCSSKEDIKDEYIKETKKICELLCQKKYNLVFGAYSKSMMGECLKTFKEHNQKIYGALLKEYDYDLENLEGINIEVFNNCFDRLKYLYNNSDLLIIMPGGTGTINELFGIIEEFKNNKQDKNLILYNYNHYYDNLITYLNNEFTYDKEKNKINIVTDIEEMERLI